MLVMGTVNLNGQRRLGTIEIQIVRPYLNLTTKPEPKAVTANGSPEELLGNRHFSPQLARPTGRFPGGIPTPLLHDSI
jgi:hypothetical protein